MDVPLEDDYSLCVGVQKNVMANEIAKFGVLLVKVNFIIK
jgi:hypothetical protein